MAVTTSISTISLEYKDYGPRNTIFDPYPTIRTISRKVNKASSDSASDTVNGYSFPSTGANYLDGGGGNDKLISNVNTTAPCFLKGSSDTSSRNAEVDILTGHDGTQDHFILTDLYKGDGYAIINNYDPREDFLYLRKGTGGQTIDFDITCGYTTSIGKLAGRTGTYVYRVNGDVLAFINGYAVDPLTNKPIPFDFSREFITPNYSIFESVRWM